MKSMSLIKHVSVWKAKDFRNFFLICFPFYFLDKKEEIIEAILHLRQGMFLLLNKNVPESNVDDSKVQFEKFLEISKSQVGQEYITPNFHELYHLLEIARKTGSLSNFSCFNFEHINGILIKLCHGNKPSLAHLTYLIT